MPKNPSIPACGQAGSPPASLTGWKGWYFYLKMRLRDARYAIDSKVNFHPTVKNRRKTPPDRSFILLESTAWWGILFCT